MLSQTLSAQPTRRPGTLSRPRRNYTPLPSQVIKKAGAHGLLGGNPGFAGPVLLSFPCDESLRRV